MALTHRDVHAGVTEGFTPPNAAPTTDGYQLTSYTDRKMLTELLKPLDAEAGRLRHPNVRKTFGYVVTVTVVKSVPLVGRPLTPEGNIR